MDINSIIEMIERLREQEDDRMLDSRRYILACDDIIEQLRKMSDETIAWESTTEAYKKYITESQYQKFSDDVKKWYKPYCKMSDWQPIETAPKDARILVVCCHSLRDAMKNLLRQIELVDGTQQLDTSECESLLVRLEAK